MNDSKFATPDQASPKKATPTPANDKQLVDPEEEETRLGCCARMSSYVLNHEFLDLQAHDKGSGNVKCMTCCQLGFRVLYYTLLIVVIVVAFIYPISQGTGSGEVKKIRTYESQNQFK